VNKPKTKIWSKRPALPLVDVLVQRIRSGVTMKQLCQEYRVQSSRIAAVLSEGGCSYKVLREEAMRSDVLLALERIKGGEPVSDVAAESVWPPSRFVALIREAAGGNVRLIKPKRAVVSDSVSGDDVEKAVAFLADGVPLRQIADDLGYHLQHLYVALQRHTGKKVNDLKGWSPRQQEFARLAGEGLSLGEIARQCGVSRQRVSQVLQGIGIDLPSKIEKDKARAVALSLLGDGLDRHQIAAKAGLCAGTVVKMAHKEGVSVPRKKNVRTKPDHPAKQLAIQDAKDGESYSEIAKKYGVALMTVHVWAKAAGVAPRTRGTVSKKPLADLDVALRFAREGLSSRQIAIRLNCCPIQVRREVRRVLGDGYFRKRSDPPRGKGWNA